MRILAIDYGRKRCGIASTDPLQIIANGLTTVPTHTLMTFLADYFQKEAVERIILGYPMQPNGNPSENLQRVKTFAGQFAKKFPTIPITFYDERYTSKLAHQAMLESGISKKRRQDKALVDEISACIILQDYLTSKEFQK